MAIEIFEKFIGVTVLYNDGHSPREYVITGRRASSKKPSGRDKVLWEIQPVNLYNTNKANIHFNRWVTKSALMEIEDKRPPVLPSVPIESSEIKEENKK